MRKMSCLGFLHAKEWRISENRMSGGLMYALVREVEMRKATQTRSPKSLRILLYSNRACFHFISSL